MKREIKFRGVETQDGGCRMVSGAQELVTFTLEDLLADTENFDFVDPDTVVQLVGYDKDGNEIYEGDTLVDAKGNYYIARLERTTQNTDTTEFYSWEYPSQLKLKEEDTK